MRAMSVPRAVSAARSCPIPGPACRAFLAAVACSCVRSREACTWNVAQKVEKPVPVGMASLKDFATSIYSLV